MDESPESAGSREALEAELARLRESEKLYRTSAELSSRLVWSASADGAIQMIRSPYANLTGRGEESALGEGWLDVLHPDDAARVAARWRRSLESGEPYEAEFRARHLDGVYRMSRSRAVAVRDEDGKIRGWSGTTENIEEEWQREHARRDAEERLRESEELYRYTVELSQQIVWTIDADGKLLTMGPRFGEMTGVDPHVEFIAAVHPDDREMVVRRWEEAFAAGHLYQVQYRLRLVDGSYRHMRVRAAPRRDAEGRIIRWYGTIEDIHEQREADFARRDVEERYRLAAQATNDAIWDYDLIADVIDWSDNAAAILCSDQDPLGRTNSAWWKDRIHPEDRALTLRGFENAIIGGARRWSATYRFHRDDGRYADIFDRGFIIRTVAGEAVRAVGAMADLTERHRAEAEIGRMQAELFHVSRLSAMGTMASTLAHELNQPLTAIGNFISGAKRVADRLGVDDPALRDALDAAEGGALRAAEIVRRLRELVSRGTASVNVEHLQGLIEDACVLAFLDEEMLGVRHRLDLDAAVMWVRADRVQIQQVLINLVRNAVDATGQAADKEIVIATRAVDRDTVEVSVADRGVGLGEGDIDSLFSQFMTTKSGGMGIGLPISRTIVEAHGGKIWGENRPGGGAVFRFTLPRATGRRETL